jgi:hypothetical protein
MELKSFVDRPIIAELQLMLPGVEMEPIVSPLPGSSELSVRIDLPASLGAEFSYKLGLQPERQIHAAVVGANGVQQYFWYMPFEDAGFKGSSEKLDKAFLETLKLLVSHETRIVQETGLLFHSFRCEYNANGRWNRVYSVSCLRFGCFKTPLIAGRKHAYHSPALASGNR